MSKKSKRYDCIFIETDVSSGLTSTDMINAIKSLNNDQLIAFDTGLSQTSYEFCAQGFVTNTLLEHLDYDINTLLHYIMPKYNPDMLEPQSFSIVTQIGDKFSILIQ